MGIVMYVCFSHCIFSSQVSSSERKDRPSSHQSGTSFIEGGYNEEEARASFQQALVEWRNMGKKAISSSSSDAAACKGR